MYTGSAFNETHVVVIIKSENTGLLEGSSDPSEAVTNVNIHVFAWSHVGTISEVLL